MCYNEAMKLIDCKPYTGMRVCVALSGGRDSVALLHALKTGGVKVSALTCGHGMRAASEADIAFVEGLCRDWNVPLRVFRADIPARAKAQKRGLEETARVWRYECFARVVAEGEADTVATAHHKDDLAETLLFRLARGTSAAGLNVFPARAGIVRPLLGVTRAQIDAYVTEHALPFVEDESNADVAFSRNRIRHNVLPELELAVPGARDNLVAFAARAAEDDACLCALAAEHVRVEDGMVHIPLALPMPVFSRAVVQALSFLGVTRDYTAANVAQAARLRELQSGRRASLPCGIQAVREGDAVVFCRPRGACPQELPFAYGTFQLGDDTVMVSPSGAPGALMADMDAFPAGCVLRTRREGDMITPFGGGRKTLKKFLTGKKIPARIGHGLPLVAKGSEVYAVIGVEIADDVKVTEKTAHRVWLSVVSCAQTE